MKTLREIFYSELEPNDDNIIKTVEINWNQHSFGIINIAKSIEPDFVINETNKDTLKQLLLYFSGSSKFDGSLRKGIMLIGSVGTGKSLLFRVFKEYTSQIIRLNSFQYHTSQEIIDNVNVKGVEYMDLFNHNYDNPITCYIDDIASRNEVIKYYGTEVNVMEQLLSIRYNIYSRYRKLTHVTSNKYPSDFKELYDDRIVDRMKEMFNIIELTGESFRK